MGDAPAPDGVTIDFERIIRAASLAPSPDNNCPWRFEEGEAVLRIFLEGDGDFAPDVRRTLDCLSLGAVVTNVCLEARAQGLVARVHYPSDASVNEYVRVDFSPGTAAAGPSYHAMSRRRTDRSPYATRALPQGFLAELETLPTDDSLRLTTLTGRGDRAEIGFWARTVARLDRLRFSRRVFHTHLYNVLRFASLEMGQIRTGLFAEHLQLPPLAATLLRLMKTWWLTRLLNVFGLSRLLSLATYRQMLAVGGVGIISGRLDDRRELIRAGELMQRVWLLAESHGLSVHPQGHLSIFHQMQESREITPGQQRMVREVLEQGRARLGVEGHGVVPLIIFRIGEGAGSAAPCVRPTVDELRRASTKSTSAYAEAFSRNEGIISTWEQEKLRHATVAIPGLGGVGGIHMMTLTRMGIGGFHIADGDTFERANFNRQYGASEAHLGKNKADVMESLAREINPDLRIQKWNEPITERSARQFLTGCDVVMDSMDAFNLKDRRTLITTAQKMSIPVVAAGPVGFSCSMLVYLPRGPSFDDYMDYREGGSNEENFLRFILGTVPRPYFMKYMDAGSVDADHKKGPSVASSVTLCAGFAAVEATKLLLGRGKVHGVPHYHYYDPYLGKLKIGRIPGGNKNPIQRLLLRLMLRKLGSKGATATVEASPQRG